MMISSTISFKKDIKKSSLGLTYFLRNGWWVSLRYITVSLSGLILSIGFAHLLSKEMLGQYQLILAFLGIVSLFSIPGLNIAALKAVAEGKQGVLKKAVYWSFLGSLIGIPVILAYSGYALYIKQEIALGLSLVVAAFLFPFFYAPNTWYVVYEGKRAFRPAALRIILSSIISTLGLIIAALLHLSLPILVLTYLATNAIFNWFFFAEAERNLDKKQEVDSIDLSFAFKVSLQKFALSLSENIPALAIAYVYGYSYLAIFQIAFIFVNAIAGFLSGLSSIYFPVLFGERAFDHHRAFLQNIALGIFIFVVFRIALELFFPIFYGESYSSSLVIARSLSFLILLFPLKSFLTIFFTAKGRNFSIVVASITSNIAAILILFIVKKSMPESGVIWYTYMLNLIFLLPLLALYLIKMKEQKPSAS